MQYHPGIRVLDNADARMHVVLVIHVFGGSNLGAAFKALVSDPNPIFGDQAFAEVGAAPEDVVERQISKADHHVGIGSGAPQRIPLRIQLQRGVGRAKMARIWQRRPMSCCQLGSGCRLAFVVGSSNFLGGKPAIIDLEFVENAIQ